MLTVMEGGVMQARTHRDVAFFDGSVRQLAAYFAELANAPACSGDRGSPRGEYAARHPPPHPRRASEAVRKCTSRAIRNPIDQETAMRLLAIPMLMLSTLPSTLRRSTR